MNRKSVFARLLGIFFVAGIALIISFVLPFKMFSDDKGRTFFINNISEYADLIVNEYERNPNYADELYQNTHLKIEKVETDAEQAYIKSHFEEIHFKKVSDKIKFDRTFHKSVVVYEKEGYSYFIINHKEHSDRGALILLVTAILCLIIFFFTYKAVTKLFSPLKEIHQGVAQFSKGKFEHVIPVKGKTQFSDLSAQLNRMAHEINNKFEERNALLMAIAHEIKTPLASARINAELIEESEESEKIKKEIREIDKLINTVVHVNRNLSFENDNFKKVDFESFLSNVEGVKLTQYAKNFKADENKIQIILVNLIENAKKYGSEEVHVDVFEKEITIRDFGPGVKEENLLNLTKPFYRVNSARTRGEGFGLGLYLVEKLVQGQDMNLIIENANPGLIVKIRKNN